MTEILLSEMRGGLMVLTMNRPESRNALNPALCMALAERLAAAAEDPAVRAVVLTGAGGTFCVGGDVKAMNEGSGRDAPERERIAALRARMEASRFLHEMPKPTIAAIEGPAAGAGLSLALACDFRICGRNAKLTTAFAKVGLSGDYGGTYFLTQIAGRCQGAGALPPVARPDRRGSQVASGWSPSWRSPATSWRPRSPLPRRSPRARR